MIDEGGEVEEKADDEVVATDNLGVETPEFMTVSAIALVAHALERSDVSTTATDD